MANLTASNLAQLYTALASCKGGETILLAGGDYGNLALNVQTKFNFKFPSDVTIKSADPANPATFSSVQIGKASHLVLDGINFDYEFKAGDTLQTRPFQFTSCTDLTIRNSTFDGDLASGLTANDNGYATAVGLSVRNSSDVLIENCEVSSFFRGMVFSDNQGLVIRDNDIHDIRMDGMNFADVQDVLIEGNYIHDFRASYASGDHRDMIQFWTMGTTQPSTDIVIRDNVLDIGEGSFTQSIFMRNEEVDLGRAGTEMFYQNVLIENNTITNGHVHGIMVGETAGLTIRNNSVLHADGDRPDAADSGVEIPKIAVSARSTGVVVTQNVAAVVPTAKAGWTVGNNVLVQDQYKFDPNFYDDVFTGSSLDGADGVNDYVAVKGGAIDLANAGSKLTQGITDGLLVTFDMDDVNATTRVFDASQSTFKGAALPAGSTFVWTFGDGTKATGVTVQHSYAKAGEFDVTLSVKLPTGEKATETAACAIESSEVVTLDDGQLTVYDGGVATGLGALAKMSADGLQLGATGVAATVDRSHLLDIIGSDKMTLAMTLDADKAGASGEVVRLHGSFMASVTSSGELTFQVFRDGTTPVWLTTKGAGLNAVANQPHDVVVQLDSGKLQIWVDGGLAGETAMTGVIGGSKGFGTHDLVFGNPFSRTNFNGDLSAFELSQEVEFAAKPATKVLKATTASVTVTSAMEDDSDYALAAASLDDDGSSLADATDTDDAGFVTTYAAAELAA
ncbi:right-handed parallel beta-helix repeat-containing protein [Rubellimicrobium aerolatum]|uniref:Right-handed parallel beta-helix repeat-containing protein n=1 Tax=Rubellimicrobium aerolatum TaxID=490979 RepID=A0ABW0S9D7_9RHOB|nr:right-handed parallel beta-helix repeat-containing protein [Rubellimicrobium aerolatum]MBP1804918.1 PKD repeat protein [Rubellimicrobium aerolatum]